MALAVKVSARAAADNASGLGTPDSPKNDAFNILLPLVGVKFQEVNRGVLTVPFNGGLLAVRNKGTT